MSDWLSRVFGDFEILPGRTKAERFEVQKEFTDPGGTTYTGTIGGGGGGGSLTGVVDASNYSGDDGGEQIQAAVDDAESDPGPNVVYVPAQGPDDVSGSTGALGDADMDGNAWRYSSRVTMPDDTLIVVAGGGHHFLADGANVGFYGNADRSGGNTRMGVVGWGGKPVLNGNTDNQSNNVSGTEYNALMWFVNVDSLHIENYRLIDSYEWNHRFRLCTDITGGDLAFDNSHVHGDGVHFLACEGVELHGLSGATGDDFIAIGTGGDYESNSSPYGDARDITITGIRMESTAYGAMVKIMPSADYQVEDISISGFTASPATDQQGVVVRAADTSAGSLPENGDCRNITVSDGTFNLSYSSVLNAPLAVVGEGACSDVTMSNVHARGNHSATFLVGSDSTCDGVEVRDATDTRPGGGGSGIDVEGTATNLTINGWVIESPDYVFNSSGTVDGTANNIVARSVSNAVYRSGSTGEFKFGPNCPVASNMPPHVVASIITADSAADPDGDGNGEIVISDGTEWNEMADMPAI